MDFAAGDSEWTQVEAESKEATEPKKKIVLVGEIDEGTIYAMFDYESPNDHIATDDVTITRNPRITLEEIADFSDARAEARNNHDFIFTHRILSAILFKSLGREVATKIMLEIAEYGGLDGIQKNEWGCSHSALDELGVVQGWVYWSLLRGSFASKDKTNNE